MIVAERRASSPGGTTRAMRTASQWPELSVGASRARSAGAPDEKPLPEAAEDRLANFDIGSIRPAGARPPQRGAAGQARLWAAAIALSLAVHAGAIVATLVWPSPNSPTAADAIPVEIVASEAAPDAAPTAPAEAARPTPPPEPIAPRTESPPAPVVPAPAPPEPAQPVLPPLEPIATVLPPAPAPPVEPPPAPQPPEAVRPASPPAEPAATIPPPASAPPVEPPPAPVEPTPQPEAAQKAPQEPIATPPSPAPPLSPTAPELPAPLPAPPPARPQPPPQTAPPQPRASQLAKPRAEPPRAAPARAPTTAPAEPRLNKQQPAAPLKAAAPAASGAEIAAYQGAVAARLSAVKRYPEAARERAPHGVAIVSFSIGATGQAAGISLSQSAGDAALDAEAIATVRRASPFPPPPSGAPRTFSAPLSFRAR